MQQARRPAPVRSALDCALLEFHERTGGEFNQITDLGKLTEYCRARDWHWLATVFEADNVKRLA